MIWNSLSRRFNNDYKLLSTHGLPEEKQRKLFRKYLCYVEVELFSFCNRRCWFCPNSRIDRLGRNHFLPEKTYLSLLEQLAKLKFSGQISFSRYNEPLADRIIMERLEQARAILPGVRLHSNTNGDYLNAEYLEQLKARGLNSLCIQNYQVDGRNRPELFADMEAILQRLNIPPDKVARKTELTWLECVYQEQNFILMVRSRNFHKDGNSRGGALAESAVPRVLKRTMDYM